MASNWSEIKVSFTSSKSVIFFCGGADIFNIYDHLSIVGWFVTL